MEVRRLAGEDPRCKNFIQMLKDYGLRVEPNAVRRLLFNAAIIEDETPNAVNDKREYYRTVYLQTEHWKTLKKSKLASVSACEFCASISNLDVHHRRYRSLYDVENDDLAVLCRKCHDELHASVDANLRGTEKEDALDAIFMERVPSAVRPHRRVRFDGQSIWPCLASERRKFERLLQRMISVASKIKKEHGISLAPKVRKFFQRKIILDV